MSESIAGFYQHYKGGIYEVYFLAKHSETLEDLVVYRMLDITPDTPSEFWVRPAKMFFETIEHEGITMPRFKLMHREEVEALNLRLR